MKKLFLLPAILFWVLAFSQQPYWQQTVNYNINVSLNDQDHSLSGYMDIEYINNSPDTLQFIWFHLWPNAYKNETTAFAKQVIKINGKRRWKLFKEKGFIDSLNFKINNHDANTEAHPEFIDVMKLILPTSLKPGEKIKITTPFYVKLPEYISRGGHYAQSYMICQWYPKPAVYDRKGWHPMPYLEQGEFYSEFGKFDVNITLPAQYVVGATGELKNNDELATYKKIGAANYVTTQNIKYYNSNVNKTLLYTAENVHDFAWFADKNFIIEHDTLQLTKEKIIDVFAFHQPGGNKYWDKATDYIKSGVRYYSEWIGDYAYPVVAAVEGPQNDNSGGMEYPMITLITQPGASEPTLDAVITHEVGHNWFYGILGSNERDHPWMDEGLNTYYQFKYEAVKYMSNSIFERHPPEVKNQNEDQYLATIYMTLNRVAMNRPIETPSHIFNDRDYGLTAYIKAATWMYLLELELGKDALQKTMQAYFTLWKFKHPYPEDLKNVFEKVNNRNLDIHFNLLKKKKNL